MESLHQRELEVIAAIQEVHGPLLDGLFRIITVTGGQGFYLLLLPLLFWCVNRRQGARLMIVFLLSVYLNVALKELFQQPRPFDLDPGLKLHDVNGYGLPSGHAQLAVVVWGGIGVWARRIWVSVAAIGAMALIGFSRVYLGVHFPTDVVVGWTMGVLVLGLYLALRSGVEGWLTQLGTAKQVAVALAVPTALLLVHASGGAVAAMGAGRGWDGAGVAVPVRCL